jgi:hypothetical protein
MKHLKGGGEALAIEVQEPLIYTPRQILQYKVRRIT